MSETMAINHEQPDHEPKNYQTINQQIITKKSQNYQSKTLIFPKFTLYNLLYEENIPLYPCRDGKFAA